MNRIKLIKFITLLICLVSFNVYGQRKEISKEEFLIANKTAGDKMKMVSYRFISKNENYFGDELKSVQTNTNEFVPPDKRHNVLEVKMFDMKRNFLTETIRIGNDEYKRENGGEWTKRTKTEASQSPNNPIKTIENNSKFYLTENVKLGSQTANLYEAFVENKVLTPTRAGNEPAETTFYRKERRWINRDGLLIKFEMEDESQQMRKVVTRQTSTYEYDPNIKIEAPIK
jgi:hypothetical protein